MKGVMTALRRAIVRGGPWPIVALLLGGLASFTLIALFAPEDVRTALLGAHGLIATIIALLIGSPLGSDDSGGKPGS